MAEEERRISPGIIILGGLGLALVGVLGLATIARAAPPPGLATLYGKVTDAVTGVPLSGVLVSLNGMQLYTDSDGNYSFTDLEPGEYVLQFSKEGYETAIY